jgi:cell division protein FtsL
LLRGLLRDALSSIKRTATPPVFMEVYVRLVKLAICAALLLPIGAVHAVPAAVAGGRLTQEERFLYMRQQHGLEWRNLTLAQRCERKREMRRAHQAMTPAAFAQLKQKLDAEWNAMSAADKQRIEQRIAARRTRRTENPRARNEPRCAGGSNKRADGIDDLRLANPAHTQTFLALQDLSEPNSIR